MQYMGLGPDVYWDDSADALLYWHLGLVVFFAHRMRRGAEWAAGVSRWRLIQVAAIAGLAGGATGMIPAEGLALRFVIGGVVAAGLTWFAVRREWAFQDAPDDARVTLPADARTAVPAEGGRAE